MKSPYCQWLTHLQELAAEEGIVLEAQHHDCLDLLFKENLVLEEALERYKDFVRRWHALVPDSVPVVITAAKEMITELETFVIKHDAGEVKSVNTYHRFKKILKKYRQVSW